jgi:hypothetical protein
LHRKRMSKHPLQPRATRFCSRMVRMRPPWAVKTMTDLK